MDPRTHRQQIFRPLNDAASDTWLQVRAKPLIYVLIWVSLALIPYVLLGLAFQAPLGNAIDEYFSLIEQIDITAITEGAQLPQEYMPLSLEILGYYGLIFLFLALVAVFMGAVMAGTISRFRDRSFPRYLEALGDGAALYPRFLVSVLYTVVRIFFRPFAVGLVTVLLGVAFRSTFVSTMGFFAAFFFVMTDLNRYGLAPFVHLSLGSSARDSIGISKAFYLGRRPIVSSLFMTLVLFPVIFFLLLYSIFLGSGFYFVGGVYLMWFLQSVAQFVIAMILINFARNTFIQVEEKSGGAGDDIPGEAVVLDDE